MDRQLWQNLKDARSYEEWVKAAKALNASDPDLLAWKEDPKGEYAWETIQERYVISAANIHCHHFH